MLLTGQGFFAKYRKLDDIITAHIEEQPAPPSTLNNDLPKSVDRVIMRMLEKDPAKRFKNFRECYDAWNEILANAGSKKVAGSQLLGEDLLRLSKKEKDQMVKQAVGLGVIWFAMALATIFGEGVLRKNNLHWLLDASGWLGTAILVFSLSCIAYVACARRGYLPVIGSLRTWLITHIATAIPAIVLMLIHSGNFLHGIAPGPPEAKPILSIVMTVALIITAISGATGLLIFRGLRKQLAVKGLNLRGDKSSQAESMRTVLAAQLLSGWRLVHYPLAILFVLLTVLHILQSVRFGI